MSTMNERSGLGLDHRSNVRETCFCELWLLRNKRHVPKEHGFSTNEKMENYKRISTTYMYYNMYIN